MGWFKGEFKLALLGTVWIEGIGGKAKEKNWRDLIFVVWFDFEERKERIRAKDSSYFIELVSTQKWAKTEEMKLNQLK